MPDQHDEFFRLWLREARLSVTDERLAILRVFWRAKVPVSARRVMQLVGKQSHAVTVYRALRQFEEKGLVRKVDLRHNHAHYELLRRDHHHHLVCEQCGRVEDITHCRIESMTAYILRQVRGFATIRSHALEFFGICTSCAQKRKGGSSR